jgi:hypothetical protein
MSEREEAATLDTSAFAPEDFARLIAGSTDEMIAQVVEGPHRRQVLDEIFSRMAEHVEAGKAKGTDAVVHFKMPDPVHDREAEAGGRPDARQPADRLLPHSEGRLSA